jgi:hypothetical protein
MDEIIELLARPIGPVAWIQHMLINWQVLV